MISTAVLRNLLAWDR